MHNRLIKTIAIAVASILPAIAIGLQASGLYNLPVEFTFILILIQSSTLAFSMGGSLFKVYFSFSYFFFGLAPYLEFKNQIVYWGGDPLSNTTYLLTNTLIIFLNTGFLVTYLISKSTKAKGSEQTPKEKKILTLNNSRGLIGTGSIIFISLAILLYINNFSILSLLFRGGEYKELIELTGPTQTLIQSFFRFLPMVMLIAYLQYSKRPLFPTISFLILATIAASPLGMPRFMVAALYLPLLFTFLPSLVFGNKLPLLLFAALAIIFPLLNEFRNYSDSNQLTVIHGFDFLLEGHFDSYQSLARVLQENIITWGHQLLGVLLFFIPRTVWESKPIGTGAEIAKQQGYEFSNISANFYTEGYINFGLTGCVVFCIAIAYWCSRLDRQWERSHNELDYFRVSYYLAIGYIFFVLRGDLLSATANGISLILANKVTQKIVQWSSKEKN